MTMNSHCGSPSCATATNVNVPSWTLHDFVVALAHTPKQSANNKVIHRLQSLCMTSDFQHSCYLKKKFLSTQVKCTHYSHYWADVARTRGMLVLPMCVLRLQHRIFLFKSCT
uniref:Uncharacterized protein n=1 Tax=Rhipicephalus zambeziensis TaxID=60191 RepID=A0A224YFY1_9ACAR